MEEPGFSREISVTKTGAGNMLDGPKTSYCVTLESKDMFKSQNKAMRACQRSTGATKDLITKQEQCNQQIK